MHVGSLIHECAPRLSTMFQRHHNVLNNAKFLIYVYQNLILLVWIYILLMSLVVSFMSLVVQKPMSLMFPQHYFQHPHCPPTFS
jgi:hypothetical protein